MGARCKQRPGQRAAGELASSSTRARTVRTRMVRGLRCGAHLLPCASEAASDCVSRPEPKEDALGGRWLRHCTKYDVRLREAIARKLSSAGS